MADAQNHLEWMPVEILKEITTWLPDHDKYKFSATSKKNRSIIRVHFKKDLERATGKSCGFCNRQMRVNRLKKAVIKCGSKHMWLVHKNCWKTRRCNTLTYFVKCPDPRCKELCLYHGNLYQIEWNKFVARRKLVESNKQH